jgi:hypothetical protein
MSPTFSSNVICVVSSTIMLLICITAHLALRIKSVLINPYLSLSLQQVLRFCRHSLQFIGEFFMVTCHYRFPCCRHSCNNYWWNPEECWYIEMCENHIIDLKFYWSSFQTPC